MDEDSWNCEEYDRILVQTLERYEENVTRQQRDLDFDVPRVSHSFSLFFCTEIL